MNTVYYSDKGKQINLDMEIGRGGEGPVFAIKGDPSDCAKIYFKEKITPEHHSKLIAMVKNPPSDPCYKPKINQIHRSIAWPSSILYADRGNTQFAGFVMPKLDMKMFSKALLYINPEDRRRKYFGGITWRHLLVIARNISSAIAAVHERGYCVGDINESNILIAQNALITLIDCDSFQVRDDSSNKVYRCSVGKEEYSAPELIGKSYKDINRTFDTDAFALSVLIFQLLMEGFHPFGGRWQLSGEAPKVPYKIQKGLFPYGRKLNEITPQPDAPSYEIIHPEIQKLFYGCFVDGHGNPKNRPTAQEWMNVLSGIMGNFKKCSKNDNHLYLNHLDYCPWCEKNNKIGEDKDSFPSHVGLQVPLGDPTKSIQTLDERIDYLRTYIDMALSDGAITTDENEYIIEMGLKLQIPKKEIEKVIADEIKNCGIMTSSISKAGIPILEISKASFIFSTIRKGSVIPDSFTISNVGGGVLSGPIKTNKKWLKVSQNNIDTTKHKQDIAFHVDTSTLAFGFRDTGTIEIQSNGGTESVNVTISIEPNIAARKRRNKYIAAGVGLSILIFIIVQIIVGQIHKQNQLMRVQDVTGKLPGEWQGKVGDKEAKLIIAREGGKLSGKIIYDGVEEKLSVRCYYNQRLDSIMVELEGTDDKRFWDKGRFSLDEYYGHVSSDNNSISGDFYKTLDRGHGKRFTKKKWFVTRIPRQTESTRSQTTTTQTEVNKSDQKLTIQSQVTINISGEWNGKVNNKPATLKITQNGNSLSGNIVYDNVTEHLSGEINNDKVVLRGTGYTAKGVTDFSLDTFSGTISSQEGDFIRGNYTDEAGNKGTWFVTKSKSSPQVAVQKSTSNHDILSEDEVKTFIEKRVNNFINLEIDEIMKHYADDVDFWEYGFVTKDFIRQKIISRNKEWPNREYRIGSSITVIPGNTDNEKTAQYTVHSIFKNDRKTMETNTYCEKTLRKRENQILIIREKGEKRDQQIKDNLDHKRRKNGYEYEWRSKGPLDLRGNFRFRWK